jgi:hypothetical protein
MAGFKSDTVYADNVDFTGSSLPTPQVTANGQLLIGSAVAPNIRVATLTPGPGVNITNGAGTITIGLTGGGTSIDSIAVQTGTSPILPDGSGLITINGAVVAAGTNPVRSDGTGANTLAIEVQTSQAIASADATKIGLSNFNSSQFSVAATGFVSIINAGFTWTDVTGATQTIAVQNGYLTDRGGGVTYTLPATAAIGDTFIVVGKAGLATITPNANQQILIGSASGTVGATGTAVSTNAGDSITFVCTTSGASTVWRASSFVGNWTLN